MNPVRNPLKLARRVTAVAPAILAKHFRPDCCIAATKVAIGVFARFGLKAVPLATNVLIWNPAYTARVKAGKPAVDSDELIRLWDADGSWVVGIGFGPPTRAMDRPGWDGHLIAAVDVSPGPILIDLSLTQADRPERKIGLEPTVFVPPSDFWTGLNYTFVDVNGCGVGYCRKPTAVGFVMSPDWQVDERTDPVIDEIVRELG